MNLNPLSLVERRISVPRDLSAITSIDLTREVNPEWLGMTLQGRDAIWDTVERLYRTGMYPAVQLCIRRHGEVLLNRSIGHIRGNGPNERGDKVLATQDSPFCLYSGSKAVTAMLIHLLEEQGLINLLNPVSFYIPEFAQNGKKHITVQQILAHRAGIATLQKKVDPERLFDHDFIMQTLYEARPTTRQGRHQGYHALTGGYILGELVQRVTGMDIREFMRLNVQEPLNFKYFNYGIPRAQYPELARNYFTGLPLMFPVSLAMEKVLGASLETAIDVSNDPRFYDEIIPAGNLCATAEEASRFFQCLLNGGELGGTRIFQPITIERAIREVGKMQLDRVLMMPMRYSAGMMLGYSPIGMYGPATPKAFGHLGLTNNFCWADPDRAISVSLLTSGNPVVGSHLPALLGFLTAVSKHCKPVFRGRG
ncbi:Predicted beta-lactamase [gamma proteobacterium HdN1]|nr:Predicted beta-lactamase [gamma proteobacterium HdN1]